MSEVETIELLEGVQIKILNNTGEDLVLQAEKIEKGMFKKGQRAPSKIESYEEKSFGLVACEGSCEGGVDIEGWVKYGMGCTEGYCKIHFRYIGKTDKLSYSCECHMRDGKMLCEATIDEKAARTVNWIIGPKA
ncbi:hypothetical protein EQO05_14890 [Methanosarcina sp. MSH10X1]|uniref:hypothetical protein n=1 Tax=Methanosarcina sp. MSH10X1 TaxID=2507075 RepID=UPI000FFCB59A|nr:hypothetical protein [Methanosarcina sp. MSH10X1]RXA15173.1 hypothetical protein EQO05_14890 [Methanosarcina sp. MSH10X1]